MTFMAFIICVSKRVEKDFYDRMNFNENVVNIHNILNEKLIIKNQMRN